MCFRSGRSPWITVDPKGSFNRHEGVEGDYGSWGFLSLSEAAVEADGAVVVLGIGVTQVAVG